MIEAVTTFYGTPDGQFRVELVDGLITTLRLPDRLVDPASAHELATQLVAVLDQAFAKHTQDWLAATADPDPVHDAVARYAADAVAEAGRVAPAPAHPAERIELPDTDDIEVAWRHGAVAAIRFGHRRLMEGAAELGRRVATLINRGPARVLDPDVAALIDQLDPDEVRRDLERVKQLISPRRQP